MNCSILLKLNISVGVCLFSLVQEVVTKSTVDENSLYFTFIDIKREREKESFHCEYVDFTQQLLYLTRVCAAFAREVSSIEHLI